ncbi:MAG: L,D-transpeptidase [Methyloceanibacter sp.]|uniref:L,D-transpeptidase n=1 Tax=Methyloceanibacter sp. TaxID=1965321 RepID=UPI003D6C8B7D
MRILAATFAIICGCAVTPALAYDGPQPLTRAGCDQAQLAWDENANVCTTAPKVAGGTPDLAATPPSARQPLTRAGCEQASLTWDDNANVCDAALEAIPVDVAVPAPSEILIDIDKAKQKMVVWVDGTETYTWPVSTGRAGYSTPSGSFTPGSMNEIWYSRQWDNAPMPHAIFFTKKGHAIHGSLEVKHLGRPASHGCVRISPENAETLYQLVEENGLDRTKVVLAGLTPGGEHVSPAASSNTSYVRVSPAEEVQPKRRGGLLKRLFGQR